MSKPFFPFVLECKRALGKKRIIILILIILTLVGIAERGLDSHRESLAKSQEFHETEKTHFKQMKSYNLIGFRGVNLYFIQSKFSFLMADLSLQADMSANFNALTELHVFQNLKTPSLFKSNRSSIVGFSGSIFILLTILVAFFGVESFLDGEYLKTLGSSYSFWQVYMSIILTRLTIILFSLLSIYVCIYFIFLFKFGTPVKIELMGMLVHWNVTLILLSFLFFLGALIGLVFKSKGRSLTVTLVAWIILIFFLMIPLDLVLQNQASTITSNYKSEVEQIKIVMEFESESENKYGKYDADKPEYFRISIEHYWKEYFPKIEKVEERLKREFRQIIHEHNRMSMYTPISFYLLSSNELSGSGYSNYLRFYEYSQKLRNKFVRYWIDHKYYSDPTVMVPFIKGEENLFHGESVIPRRFFTGVFINLGYLLILFFISFLLFKRNLQTLNAHDLSKLNSFSEDLNRGKFYPFQVTGGTFKDILHNLLTGNLKHLKKQGFQGHVFIDGKETGSAISNYVYLCNLPHLPGNLTVKSYISFFANQGVPPNTPPDTLSEVWEKELKDLDLKTRCEAVLYLLDFLKSDIYLIDDISSHLPENYGIRLLKKMENLVSEGSLVIYLTPETAETEYLYCEGRAWYYRLKAKMQELENLQRKDKDS